MLHPSSRIALRFLLASSLAVAAVGCNEAASDVQSFVSSGSAQNIAGLFMGNAEGIPGVYQDPPHVEAALKDARYGFNFVTIEKMSKSEDAEAIIARSGELAAKALELDKGATFLWYFSGHGSDGGILQGQNRGFTFDEVGRAMKAKRGNKAFKRLVVIVDACYSGDLKDGPNSVKNLLRSDESDPSPDSDEDLSLAPGSIDVAGLPQVGVGADDTSRALEALLAIEKSVVSLKDGLYEELILILSSSGNETSGDSGNGGVGTNAFLTAMAGLKQNATINDLFVAMGPYAMGQTPVFRTDPEALRQEPFFDASQSKVDPTKPQPTAQPNSNNNSNSQPNGNGPSIFDIFFGMKDAK